MVSIKAIANAGEHTPERFIGVEHKNLYDIQDTDLYVKDFEVFTSSNVEKYDNDNTDGVIILVEMLTGEKYTVVTHSKSIVRIFKNAIMRGYSGKLDDEICQFHLGTVNVKGKDYPQWQII